MGIGIREFSKISRDSSFLKSCEIYKTLLKNDREAKEFSGIADLDFFKKDLKGFQAAVQKAVEFIQRRKDNRALRKAEGLEGVDLVYEDERFFVVSPKSSKYSRKAAYLDNGTANWCIAATGKSAEEFWEQYNVRCLLYVFLKGKAESWVMVFSDYDIFKILQNSPAKRYFSLIENRKNDIGKSPKKISKCFSDMLRKISKTPEGFLNDVRWIFERRGYRFKDISKGALREDDVGVFERFLPISHYRPENHIGDYLDYGSYGILKWVFVNTRKDKKFLSQELLLEGIKRNLKDVVDLALENGADLNPKEGAGDYEFVPIYMAIRGNWEGEEKTNDNAEMVKYLVSKGARLDYETKSKNTLLHLSVLCDGIKCTKYFLEMGLEPNAVNERGDTPLFHIFPYVSFGKAKALCDVLLEHGASYDIVNKNGEWLAEKLSHVGYHFEELD